MLIMKRVIDLLDPELRNGFFITIEVIGAKSMECYGRNLTENHIAPFLDDEQVHFKAFYSRSNLCFPDFLLIVSLLQWHAYKHHSSLPFHTFYFPERTDLCVCPLLVPRQKLWLFSEAFVFQFHLANMLKEINASNISSRKFGSTMWVILKQWIIKMLICWLVSIKTAWDSRQQREKKPKCLILLNSKIDYPYVTFIYS